MNRSTNPSKLVMRLWFIVLALFTSPTMAEFVPPADTGIPFTADQITVGKALMNSYDHRMRHLLWHSVRITWDKLTDQERADLLAALGDAWALPQPLSRDNASGEDFLYMHRRMLAELDSAFVAVGLPPADPWKDIPAPTDAAYPVGAASGFVWISITTDFLPFLAADYKSMDGYRTMKAAEARLENREYLRSVSLAQLGYDMDLGSGAPLAIAIHQYLHRRFLKADSQRRPNGSVDAYGKMATDVAGQPVKWDYFLSPGYDYLGDSFSSHLNPTFWKFHGWINRRIDQWLEIHGYQTIAQNCSGIARCYQWKGTWTGGTVPTNSGITGTLAAPSATLTNGWTFPDLSTLAACKDGASAP